MKIFYFAVLHPRLLARCPKLHFRTLSREFSFSSAASKKKLYRRISPIGDPRASIVPVLDQWVGEGNEVKPEELRSIVHELKSFKRYKHALEVSQWLSDRRYIPLVPDDVAIRMNLILKIHGINEVENYFNNTPSQLKSFQVYTALLNCYSIIRNSEKAEGIMEKMKTLGFIRTPLCYNLLLNLYHHTRNMDRMETLMNDMEEKGIHCDKFTYSIWLSAFAAASNISGMEKTVSKMESDPRVVVDFDTYAIITSGYLKVGEAGKALEILGKMELLLERIKNKSYAFRILLKQYSEAGKRDDLYRIWEMYKKTERIYNRGYLDILGAVMKFDDIDGAEGIFDEWEFEAKGLSYDFRIPDFLIGFYCRNGMLEKAEAIVAKGIGQGGCPTVTTWCCLANGYLEDDNIVKAIEVLKKATIDLPLNWRPSKEIVESCLLYLEGKGDPEVGDELAESLRITGIFSQAGINKILSSGERLLAAEK